MDDKYVHEIYVTAMEQHAKRQWIVIILLILLLAGTNTYWIHYTRQFETVVTTTIDATQDGEGLNVIGAEGVNVSEGKSN